MVAIYRSVFLSLILITGLIGAAWPQSRTPAKRDPQTQILQYYREYPDRYIRLSKESWYYDQIARTAVHSFTLQNTATVPYCEVQVKFAYQDEKGVTLVTQSQEIPGILQPYRPVDLKAFKVKGVNNKASNVVLTVSKALICR